MPYNYEKRKNSIRNEALEYLIAVENHTCSPAAEVWFTDYFEKQGMKYGLTKELREIGVID